MIGQWVSRQLVGVGHLLQTPQLFVLELPLMIVTCQQTLDFLPFGLDRLIGHQDHRQQAEQESPFLLFRGEAVVKVVGERVTMNGGTPPARLSQS